MQDIEEFNKYDFSDLIRYMRKYIDITIEDAKDIDVYEALETVSCEEILLFMKTYHTKDFIYQDFKFRKMLQSYLNEEMKDYIKSRGFEAQNSYFRDSHSDKMNHYN